MQSQKHGSPKHNSCEATRTNFGSIFRPRIVTRIIQNYTWQSFTPWIAGFDSSHAKWDELLETLKEQRKNSLIRPDVDGSFPNGGGFQFSIPPAPIPNAPQDGAEQIVEDEETGYSEENEDEDIPLHDGENYDENYIGKYDSTVGEVFRRGASKSLQEVEWFNEENHVYDDDDNLIDDITQEEWDKFFGLIEFTSEDLARQKEEKRQQELLRRIKEHARKIDRHLKQKKLEEEKERQLAALKKEYWDLRKSLKESKGIVRKKHGTTSKVFDGYRMKLLKYRSGNLNYGAYICCKNCAS